MRQTCKVCRQLDKLNFDVPDEIWNAVVPGAFRQQVVCLGCFDTFARKNNVDYAASLRAVFFAGDAAAFEFQPITVANLAATCSSG
jgi:hypothetical protein